MDEYDEYVDVKGQLFLIRDRLCDYEKQIQDGVNCGPE